MKVDLENKVTLITGASGGIGHGTALIFAKNGADIIVNDVYEEKGIAVADEIEKLGRKAIFIKADISNSQEVKDMVAKAIEEFGKIDILINNAGVNLGFNERVNIDQFNDEKWNKLIKIDLDGVYYCSKAVLKNMIKRGTGKIINISSVAGVVALRQQCAFVAAKSGVIGLTKAMALEMAQFGINVNVIAPGSIGIEVTKDNMYVDGKYESIMSHIPLKRPGTPEDIGYAALYLASDAANYVTGNVLTVDGGWTCGYMREW